MGAAAEAVTTRSAAEADCVDGRPGHGAAGARLSELFAGHGATVLGLCRLMLRHREEAEDAVQQTFLAAYGSLLNGVEPRHPAAWLATIARNECRGRIERRMREPLGEPLRERNPVSTLPDPVAAAAAKADLAELWRAIKGLPRQQREALLMREFSGLSYVELAEALAVSEPAIGSLLFRARRELRLRLRLVYGSLGGVLPFAAIREALARALGGPPDPSTTASFAKLVSAPIVAKVAAGAAAVVVAGGTVAVVEGHSVRHATSSPVERAAEPAAVAPQRATGLPASRVIRSVEPGTKLVAAAPSVRVQSLRSRGSAPVVTRATAPVRPAPREAAVAALHEPVGSELTRPSAPSSSPGDPPSSDVQGPSPGSSGSGDSATDPQGADETASSGDTAGEDPSSGSGDTGESSDSGDGSANGDSGSGDSASTDGGADGSGGRD